MTFFLHGDTRLESLPVMMVYPAVSVFIGGGLFDMEIRHQQDPADKR